MSATVTTDAPVYNEDIVRKFVIASIFWAIAAFLVGVIIAWQLTFPDLNVGPYLNFGRLRPVHTSAAIFAFGGSMLIGTSFWVVQRTCRARLFGGTVLPDLVFWGYQFFIVMAAVGYLLGATQGREYAEPEWYLDTWLTVIWVTYLVIFVGTIARRQEPHIYVANWFYLAFILTIAMLHLGNKRRGPDQLARIEKLFVFCRRAGRAAAMVVRAQRGRFLPHRRLSRHDVLLPAQDGRASDLFVPAVDRSFLVAGVSLHLGRTASPSLDRAARLGADLGHGGFR